MRVGFLGAGLIATYHWRSLERSGEAVTAVAVYDPDTARAEAFSRLSGAAVCSSEDAVLRSCDAVYVCTWTSEHHRLVVAAAGRGLAIFCEKPLSTGLVSARAMTEAVEAAGVVNQVGLVLRSSPAFLMLRQVACDPMAGRLMSVVFRDDQYIPIQGMYQSTWRVEVDKVGSGTLLEHSIHDLDVLEWICGAVASVAARSAEFHAIPGIEDVCVVTLVFESGAIGTLASVWHDLFARPSLRRVEVLCERAWCALEGDWVGPVRWTKAGGGDACIDGAALSSATGALDPNAGNPDGGFVRAVREGRPAFPGFATALRAHVVADAIYRSAASGGVPVDVDAEARPSDPDAAQ